MKFLLYKFLYVARIEMIFTKSFLQHITFTNLAIYGIFPYNFTYCRQHKRFAYTHVDHLAAIFEERAKYLFTYSWLKYSNI